MTSAARLVAFEGTVSLQRWEDSSSNGPKVRLGLLDRDALAPFEKATKRRGKKSGQRYLLILASSLAELIPDAPDECFLIGAQWSHGPGASITLAFESIEWWKRFSTADDGTPEQFHITLVELQCDETPIDQASLDAVEHANKPKGGPRSKFVAQRNQASDFQAFVGHRTDIPRDRWNLIGQDTCDKWVKQMCGVASKIEFDHNDEAWTRYENLINRPFLSWARAEYGETYGL
jgi:hypothetical protein